MVMQTKQLEYTAKSEAVVALVVQPAEVSQAVLGRACRGWPQARSVLRRGRWSVAAGALPFDGR